jgi:hypothetical protein
MVLTISEEDYMRMKETLLDQDRDKALKLVREWVKRLDQQAGRGLKSHLDGK